MTANPAYPKLASLALTLQPKAETLIPDHQSFNDLNPHAPTGNSKPSTLLSPRMVVSGTMGLFSSEGEAVQ